MMTGKRTQSVVPGEVTRSAGRVEGAAISGPHIEATGVAAAEIDAARALAYRFLSLLFLGPPDLELLKNLSRDGLLREFPVPSGNSRIAKGLAQIAAALELEQTELARVLRDDYDRLFVGPGHLPAPPWESVYRSEERLVFGLTTLEVREAYRLAGLQVPDPAVPDDHVGLELLFMAHLTERSAAGDLAARKTQRDFLNQHLISWAPLFCTDLGEHAATDLYRGLALLTSGVLEQDLELLTPGA